VFITLEGPEGGGKTLQIVSLAAFLRQQGYDVLTTREPGGTSIGEQVRGILSNLDNTAMQPRTEILLFQASRAQLVEQVIRPHLTRKGLVISDRYADSTLAYQGYGRQLPLEALRMIIDFATGSLKPDLTLLLDLDVDAGLRRKQNGGEWNRLDAESRAFHARVRAGYMELAALEPQRWVTIDAAKPVEEVQQAMRQVVMQRLAQRNAPAGA
jgi:dTMP kinase